MGPPPGPASGPGGETLNSLPSFERLADAIYGVTVLAQGEGVATTDETHTLGEHLDGGSPVAVLLGCTGGPIGVTVESPGGMQDLGTIECTGGASFFPLWPARTKDLGDMSVRLSLPEGTSWRAVTALGAVSPMAEAGAEPEPGLPSFDDLAATVRLAGGGVTHASGATGGEGRTYRIRGIAPDAPMEFSVACSGAPIEVWLADGPTIADELGAYPVTCDGRTDGNGLFGPDLPTHVSELHVRTPADTRWVAVVVQPLAAP